MYFSELMRVVIHEAAGNCFSEKEAAMELFMHVFSGLGTTVHLLKSYPMVLTMETIRPKGLVLDVEKALQLLR